MTAHDHVWCTCNAVCCMDHQPAFTAAKSSLLVHSACTARSTPLEYACHCITKAQIAFVFNPFISCPGFMTKHGCVLTGMSQARRSILNSAACQSAGSALTCWGRQPGTCRGTGKMREATTSTAASVLVQLLGAPAPCCTAPKMVARRASALGDPSHLCIVVTIVVTIVVITGTCRSMCIYESCIL